MHHQQRVRALHRATGKARHRPRTNGSRRVAQKDGGGLLEDARWVGKGQIVEGVGDVEGALEADLGRLVAAKREFFMVIVVLVAMSRCRRSHTRHTAG